MTAREEIVVEQQREIEPVEPVGARLSRDLFGITNVHELLLGFAGLNLKNRERFLSELNEFLLCSPQRRRKVIAEWGEVCAGKAGGKSGA